MTIKNLYPTQRPALDLNFANSKRLDPRVSLTRASVGTYVGNDGLIKTAAAGEARFDHDPLTGESLGLLLEAASTNYISNSLTGPAYNRFGISPAIPNSTETTSPDGTNNARLYVANGTLNDPYIQPAITGGFLSSYSSLTVSVYVKARPGFTATSLKFSSDPGLDNNPFVNVIFNPLNYASPPAVLSTGGTSAKVEYIGNGWFRCSASYNGPTITHAGSLQSTMQILGNGSSSTNGFFLWGEQLELNPYPTSYIATSGSTVTRAADVASLTNTNVYDTDSFTILNEPYGAAAGSSTLNIVGGGQTPVKRTTVYNQDLSQSQINTLVKKDDEFWRWRILGSSFALPNFLTDGQVTVDWGDGTVEIMTTSEHTFTDGGGYHDVGFRLDSGTYFRSNINNNATHKDKVIALGPAPESMKLDGVHSFYGCANLEAFDATVDVVTNLSRTWFGCSSLTSFPLIDTSSLTSFYFCWNGCTGLTSFPLLDTSNVTVLDQAWRLCSSLTSFPLIDTSNVTNFYNAWEGCSSLTNFPLIDTSSGTNFGRAWRLCSSLTSFPLLDTSSGTAFYTAWDGCSSLTSFPLLDTSSGTNFSQAWRSCSSLTSFPLIDTSSGTNFQEAWQNCSSLTSFPLIDTSSGINFSSAWYNCSSLTSFPAIDTSSGTNFTQTWRNCSSLTSFPSIDASSGSSFNQTWRNCSSLTSFPLVTVNAASNFFAAWADCSSLTDFPANFFDSWTGTPSGNCFVNAWDNCSSLTATSVENILNSIDTSGQSAPTGGVDITIDYDSGTGTPSISTAVTNLKSRGWTITLNGVAQ